MKVKQYSSNNGNQLVVPCPKWLRKSMLKNLHAVKSKSRFNLDLAARAERILQEIEK